LTYELIVTRWVYDWLLWGGASHSPLGCIERKETKKGIIYINIISKFFIKIKYASEREYSNNIEKAE
jgi:hypothetical protein